MLIRISNRTGGVFHDPAKSLNFEVGLLCSSVRKVNDVTCLVNAIVGNQSDGLIDGLGIRIAFLDIVKTFEEVAYQISCLVGELVRGCRWLSFRCDLIARVRYLVMMCRTWQGLTR